MKIQDLRIGDTVTVKGHDFPMKVVGLFGDKDVQLWPCVEDYTGDVWEEDAADLELVKLRYKLPEWKQIDEITEAAVVSAVFGHCRYEITDNGDCFWVQFIRRKGRKTHIDVAALCPTLEDAKAVAGRHFNKKIEEFLDSIKFLTDEDK